MTGLAVRVADFGLFTIVVRLAAGTADIAVGADLIRRAVERRRACAVRLDAFIGQIADFIGPRAVRARLAFLIGAQSSAARSSLVCAVGVDITLRSRTRAFRIFLGAVANLPFLEVTEIASRGHARPIGATNLPERTLAIECAGVCRSACVIAATPKGSDECHSGEQTHAEHKSCQHRQSMHNFTSFRFLFVTPRVIHRTISIPPFYIKSFVPCRVPSRPESVAQPESFLPT